MTNEPPPSRRTLTTTESAQFRRPRLAALPESPPPRPPPRPYSPSPSPSPLDDMLPPRPPPAPRRRSSLISNDSLSSLSSARRTLQSDSASILHPPPIDAHDGLSAWHSLPLAFALLPALGGLVFKDGSRVVSDILLLGLAAVFLNWSVRLPWDWYRSAQEIRTTTTTTSPSTNPPLPPTKSDVPRSPEHAREISNYISATSELRTHELLALLSCVTFPLLSAGLLHLLRGSLRAGASGLVSDFNLVVFILAAEIRPVGQLLRLVRARTLYLQRVVRVDPRAGVDERQDGEIENLRRRVEVLEQGGVAGTGEEEEEMLGRVREEVKRVTRGEVEGLSRAVRRYERRAGVLAGRVEGRLGEVEGRLGRFGGVGLEGKKGEGKGEGWVRWVWGVPGRVVSAVVWGPVGVVRGVLGWVFGSRGGVKGDVNGSANGGVKGKVH